MTIGIIGLGYVGLTLAIAAAEKGITVYGMETSDYIRQCIDEKRAHFFEPGLDELIEKNTGKAFFCVSEFPRDVKFDAFIITVGTPLEKGKKNPNFTYIELSLLAISPVYTGKELVILRSTVSVGTSRNVVLPFLSGLCGKDMATIRLAMCPERTIEGKAIEEISQLPQVIGGYNEESLQMAKELFNILTPEIVCMDSLEEAELVKLYCNVYRDIMFSVGNVLALGAQEFGVDGIKVINAANFNYPRCRIAKPGFVAGPCLEKDAYILTSNMPDCDSKDFIIAARTFNESLEDAVTNFVRKHAINKTIAISGMAFKGIPETSDLRGSTSVYIAEKLKADGYRLRLHDFIGIKSEMEDLNLGEICESVDQACQGAGLLLILNNNPKYRQLTVSENIKGLGVLDAWDVCESLEGVEKYSLGNLNIG